MMRNKTSSSLQKTFDEAFLQSSTATYFENLGNEQDALQSWKKALDLIYYHNAYRVPASYRPKSETEKALFDSLRDLEWKCKERVDLLEALEKSRKEENEGKEQGKEKGKASKPNVISRSSPRLQPPRDSTETVRSERGFMGGGSIPAVNHPDLSRPPPPLPQRPAVMTKTSSDRTASGRGFFAHSSSKAPKTSPVVLPSATSSQRTSRTPSPKKEEGRAMRMTLRSGKDDKKKASKPSRSSDMNLPEARIPSSAASMAWNSSVGKNGKERAHGTFPEDRSASTPIELRQSNSATSILDRPNSAESPMYWDSKTRTLIPGRNISSPGGLPGNDEAYNDYPFPSSGSGHSRTTSESIARPEDYYHSLPQKLSAGALRPSSYDADPVKSRRTPPPVPPHKPQLPRFESSRKPSLPKFEPLSSYPSYLKEYPDTDAAKKQAEISQVSLPVRRRSPVRSRGGVGANITSPRIPRKALPLSTSPRRDGIRRPQRSEGKKPEGQRASHNHSKSLDDDTTSSGEQVSKPKKRARKLKEKEDPILADATTPVESEESDSLEGAAMSAWELKAQLLLKNLPKGCDEQAAKQILNEIVVQGDEVHWDDVAGLDIAKNALKEAVVYPFLRPDLFMGLREPARGMLLFGPPGTGKTMLARAVATESRSTFFSISASSLTSKYLGESEKLVRALFQLAKALAPSIIFVDEIDSLLSSRSGSGEHEATRRIKTEFLIQWSDLQRAAAGREQTEKEKERGDASRVLVLAATNLPWAIDEAARRRFVRRQYIPLPEDYTRKAQLRRLLGHQKHELSEADLEKLTELTDGFSGSDITALAKDAAMGPLRSLGEALLHMSMEDIRPIQFKDFEASLVNIRPSVSKQGLKEFEDWARDFGERGG